MSSGYLGIDNKEGILRKLNKYKIVTPEGHWLWAGATNRQGYGLTEIHNKTYRVNRLSLYLFTDFDINNENIQALHKPECHNVLCWNPEHLYPGNHLDNMKDAGDLI